MHPPPTCVAVSLAEGVQCSLGFGRPVGGAGAKGAGGERLAQVVRAHLLRVVGGRLTPVCNKETTDQPLYSLCSKPSPSSSSLPPFLPLSNMECHLQTPVIQNRCAHAVSHQLQDSAGSGLKQIFSLRK